MEIYPTAVKYNSREFSLFDSEYQILCLVILTGAFFATSKFISPSSPEHTKSMEIITEPATFVSRNYNSVPIPI